MEGAGTDRAQRDEAPSRARLLVADDHDLIRWALTSMLAGEPDLEVVGQAEDGRQAITLCRELRPDLVLMDVRMPGRSGLEATRAIKAEHPDVIVLMVTAFEDPDYLVEAVRAGAAGYVLKHATRGEILGAVRGVLGGESPFDQGLAAELLQRLAAGANHQPAPEAAGTSREGRPPLTARELDVLALLAAGKTNRQIAANLHLSLSTVKTHLEHIIAKLGVSDRTQAAVRALDLGLLPKRGER